MMKILVCPHCNLHLEKEEDIKMAEEYGGCPACGLGKHWTQSSTPTVIVPEKSMNKAKIDPEELRKVKKLEPDLEQKYHYVLPRIRDLARGMYPHDFEWIEGMAQHTMEFIGEPLEYEHEKVQSSNGDVNMKCEE